MLQHIVLFRFKPETTPEQIAQIEANFAALPSQIPGIKTFEWGLNNSPEGKDKGFTHAFVLSFETEAARDAYLPDPAHKAFGASLGGHIDDVLVFDFWPQK